MTVKTTQHPWSSEALFNKALIYVGEMERYTADDWHFALWASLSLELIARAALSHISPTLLAGFSKNDGWRNIHHALGNPPKSVKFRPKSITTDELLKILKELLPQL